MGTRLADDDLGAWNARGDKLADGGAWPGLRRGRPESIACLVRARALVVPLDLVEVDEVADLLVDLHVCAVRVLGSSGKVRCLRCVADDVLGRWELLAEDLCKRDEEVLAAAGSTLEGPAVLVVDVNTCGRCLNTLPSLFKSDTYHQAPTP